MTQINNYEQPAWMSGPSPAPRAPAPGPNKRRRWPWITLGTVVAVVVIAAIAGNSGSGNGNGGAPVKAAPLATTPATSAAQPLAAAPAATAPSQDTIVYTITGGHAGDITYVRPGQGFEESQVTSRTALPWSKTWTLDPSAYQQFTLSVLAQNAGSGTIGCSITVNGHVVAQNSSSGAYAVVTCSPQ